MASSWRAWKLLLLEAFLIGNFAFLVVDTRTGDNQFEPGGQFWTLP